MGNNLQNSTHNSTPARSKPGIWLALAIALGLHALVLLLPLPRHAGDLSPTHSQIEIQLTTFALQLADEEPFIPDEQSLQQPEPESEPKPEPRPEPVLEAIAEVIPALAPAAPKSLPVPAAPRLSKLQLNVDNMTAEQKRHLTDSILSRQFINDESATDQLFGRQISLQTTDVQKEFHYPQQPNLVTMLDQPMPDLPFEYTADLIYFAYAPGVEGDLQRFWDVITPEFGWITRYGTEVQCVWVLVIAACGWK